ncbi:unnamed protein product, partial [Staurois parvus]
MSLFVILKFPAVPSPVCPDIAGNRNPEDGCRHRPGGHYRGHCRRGIAGAQDKVRENNQSRAVPHGKSECSSGLPLVVLKLYPELHSGIPPGRLKCT